MDPNIIPTTPSIEPLEPVVQPQPLPQSIPVQQPRQEIGLTQQQEQLLAQHSDGTISKKKKSPVILAIVLICIAIAGCGGWLYYQKAKNDIHNYQTITNLANASLSMSNASKVTAYIEKYFKENGFYPTSAADFVNSPNNKLPSGIKIVMKHSELSSSNGGNTVVWECVTTCNKTTGGRISYWDYKTNTLSTAPIYVGVANADSTFVAATVANSNTTSTSTESNIPATGSTNTTPTSPPTEPDTPSTNYNDTSVQASQRDAQRKNDLSRAITGVINYMSAHRGALPTDWVTFEADYLTYDGNKFIDPLGTGSGNSSASSYVFAAGNGESLTGSFSSNTQNIMYYDVGYACQDSSSGVEASGSRKVSFRIYLEGGGTYCLNN